MKNMNEKNDLLEILKNMNEKNDLLEILMCMLDDAFWKCMDVRMYFMHELFYTDLYKQSLELAEDINDLIKKIKIENCDYYIKKTILYQKEVMDLIEDVTLYLYICDDIDYKDELANRKN